jgi:hypothetical protein
MTCPTCGSEETIPLTLTTFDDLAGAARCCEECQTVYLVVNDAFLPKPLRERQLFGWRAVRAVLGEAVDAIASHPVVKDRLTRPGAEADIFRRDVQEIIETAVAAVAPILKETDEK